jgi:hypothetical protein
MTACRIQQLIDHRLKINVFIICHVSRNEEAWRLWIWLWSYTITNLDSEVND